MYQNKKKSELLVASLIAILIMFSPYLLFIHKNIPNDIESLEFLFGTIKAGHYVYVQTYVYFLLAKLVPLLLIIVWFLTNKHWWVHALIIPISVYLFQLISVINDSEQYVDEVEFIYTIPIAVFIVALLYFVRSKLSIYIQAVDLKKEMDENMKIPKKK